MFFKDLWRTDQWNVLWGTQKCSSVVSLKPPLFLRVYSLPWLDLVRSWQHAAIRVMVRVDSTMLGTQHLLVIPSVSPLHLSLLGSVFYHTSSTSSSGGGTLWSFPVPERPGAAEETWSLIRAEAWVARSLCHIQSSLARLCVNFLHVHEKKEVLFWNLMILCVLKSEHVRSWDPKIVQESVAVPFVPCKIMRGGARKRAGVGREKREQNFDDGERVGYRVGKKKEKWKTWLRGGGRRWKERCPVVRWCNLTLAYGIFYCLPKIHQVNRYNQTI